MTVFLVVEWSIHENGYEIQIILMDVDTETYINQKHLL